MSEALYIDDPDGNGVELYWDRPADQWPPPADGMITPMATLPVDLHALLDEGRGAAAVAEAAPDDTDVGHVHLQVSDVDATTRFYRDVIGLDVTAHLGSSAAFFSSNGYHHNIGTNTWRSRGAKPSPKDHAGLDRVVFGVTDGDALAELREPMRASDASWSDDAGEVVVTDPDGIELRFFAAR
ncbi:MAG: VOC family protein [Actinomycetota bacterium]|nr:VOC family protein [Actinomycetota bacterium]